MANEVKLTVRLPERLHGALRARARGRKQSLNRAMVDALAQGLAATDDNPAPERDAVAGVLIAAGLWSPGTTWGLGPELEAASATDHAALRRAVGTVPPLSAAIVEDRGPI